MLVPFLKPFTSDLASNLKHSIRVESNFLAYKANKNRRFLLFETGHQCATRPYSPAADLNLILIGTLR